MLDLLRPSHRPIGRPSTSTGPYQRSGLVLELRELAADLAGRLDRDELTLDEEHGLAVLLDGAVAAVLPRLSADLGVELARRIEALPLHARLTLVNARERRSLGLD